MITCLQRTCKLWHAVADLAMSYLQEWPEWQLIGDRCGQDGGQTVACTSFVACVPDAGPTGAANGGVR